MLSLTAILRAESFCRSRASCCLRKRFCSLRSQIFFTVKMANRQESKTRITQLHNHIFIYLKIRDVHIDDAKVSSSANMEIGRL